jgi:hypothetical protein
MTNKIQKIPIPNLKVGDLIMYRGKPQRIMQSDIPFEGSREVFLSISGITTLTGSPIEVIEQTSDDFNIGDYVVIHPIPNHEKQVYTRPYHAEYNSISDGNTIFQIQNVVRDPYRGTSVQVDGGWFLTYHVEKVGDYDIV